jgi:outer membrane protein OmpA-like peptidoglycan-associated protein
MRAIRWLAAAALGAVAASSARPASAEPFDDFQPALDTRGFVTVDGGDVLQPGDPSFGIVTSWARGGMDGVDNVVMPTLVAAIGLPFGLELAAALPFAVASAGEGRSTQEVGQLALHGKLRVMERGRWTFGLAGGVTLPDRGDGRAIVEWQGERLRLGVNAGARGRAPAAGLAASWAITPTLDAIGEAGLEEVTVGLRVELAASSHFTIGAGTGFGDPQTRAFAAIVFEPLAARRSRGGLEIDDEEIEIAIIPPPEAEEPEELDGDHDKVLDYDDLCLDEAEDYRGATDGCPELEHVAVTETTIVTFEEIKFEFDSAVIDESSYDILHEVSRSLRENPDISLVEIGGHTDARGKAAYNLDLSQRRADAVRDFLIDDDIDGRRLIAAGYGETRPAVKGTGERVWNQNRRVEFVILSR